MLNLDKSVNRQTIMLIDRWCPSSVRTSISDLAKDGMIFINDLAEITESMLDNSKTVFILESYLHDGIALPSLRLYKELLHVELIYLGNDVSLFPLVKDICRIYPCDIAAITNELIVAAIYDDDELKSTQKYADFFEDSRLLADAIVKSNSSLQVKNLANSLLTLLDERRTFEEKYDNVKARLTSAEAANEYLIKENEKLAKGYSDILAASYKLNSTLKDYEGVLSSELYKKLDLSNYPDHPIVLYFKEIEEMLGFDLFRSTLYEVFRRQNRNSVKILTLFDSYTSRRMHVTPDYYTKLYNTFTMRDVINADFIAKTGDPTKVLDMLLTNRDGLNVLIIFDCKSRPDVVLNGDFPQFNICRDISHLEAYDLVPGNTVVNAPDGSSYLAFDHDKYRRELKDVEDRIVRFEYLSARELYSNILTLTKIYRDRL